MDWVIVALKFNMQKSKLQFKIKYFIIIACIAMMIHPLGVSAATAVVTIDTHGEEINALEGTLVLPEDMHINRIGTGSSTILMWMAKPYYEEREINFAGVTPGGFSGVQPLFALHGTFYPKDLNKVTFDNVRALKNDGTGEQVLVDLSVVMIPFRADSVAPENFVPIIESNSSMFDGAYFIVFTTQDKESGVARYEIREGWFGSWREAESPYLLVHQNLDRNIYVKVRDHAGNERVVVVPAVHSNWWEQLGLFAILVLLIVMVVRYKKRYK